MIQTLHIGGGTSTHIVNPDPFILETLGQRPLCGGARVNGRAQQLTVTEGNTASCQKCQTKAAKLGL